MPSKVQMDTVQKGRMETVLKVEYEARTLDRVDSFVRRVSCRVGGFGTSIYTRACSLRERRQLCKERIPVSGPCCCKVLFGNGPD